MRCMRRCPRPSYSEGMLCAMPFEEGMPYALNFPANKVGSHEKVCLIIEYAFSRYKAYYSTVT
jgi:hypothetical protein